MIEAYIDGSFSHYGEMGVGCIVYIDGNEMRSVSKYLGKNGGKSSGNCAEYAAILELLEELKTLSEGDVTVYSDSQLVVKQMRGIWEIGNGLYAEMAKKVHDAVALCPRKLKFIWVPRKENQEADRLSKEAHQHLGRTRIAFDDR